MKRMLPFPITSGFLLVMWLLLNQTLAPGQVLLAGLVAWSVPYLMRRMQPVRATKVGRPGIMLKLLGTVVFDICRSSVGVCTVILGSAHRRETSGFMTVPLELRAPHGLAVLSCIINSTPGTVWAELSDDRRLLMLHVLDLHDEQWWINTIKQRYEKPLMAIFES